VGLYSNKKSESEITLEIKTTMKNQVYFLVLAFLLLAGAAVKAQKIKSDAVPAVVVQSLHKKYPEAAKVTWEKEKGNYEANWGGKSGEDMSVQFSPEGTFIEQVKAITPDQLPAAAIQYVHSHYKGAKISEAGKVTDTRGTIRFEAEVKGKDLLFDENGNFLKQEEE
jgi:hypothetical protein